jgi:branched-chain amino acid transport system substrate-binding protein
MLNLSRRTVLAGAASLPFASRAFGQQGQVKIALISPLSGPWARAGQLERIGVEMAVEDINKAGGIKSLGGAKLELVLADAGDSVERAKNAAQRLVAREPDLVGGIGAWLSSFTLAVTEVTERAKLPWLTLSWLDSITGRGFKYVFATSAPTSRLTSESVPVLVALAKAKSGRAIQSVGIIGESTAPAQGYLDPLRKGGLEKLGIKIVTDETFTPPLSDATPIVQRIRSAKPDFLIIYTSNVPDAKIILEKMGEFGLGNGRIPILVPTLAIATPEVLKNIGANALEGILGIATNWGSRSIQPFLDNLCARSGEPWIMMDTLSSYGHVALLHDAMERAKSIDREKVTEALRATNTNEGPAKFFLGKDLRFDQNGRRLDGPVVLFQWQGGKPLSVYPEEGAQASFIWPGVKKA